MKTAGKHKSKYEFEANKKTISTFDYHYQSYDCPLICTNDVVLPFVVRFVELFAVRFSKLTHDDE